MSPLGLRKEAMESTLLETEKLGESLTLQEIDEKILFAKRQILGLKGESAEYWEVKKAELINQGIRNSVATGTPLELTYWEAERNAFKAYKSSIKRHSKVVRPEQEQKLEQPVKIDNKIEPLISGQVDESVRPEKVERQEPVAESPKSVEIVTEQMEEPKQKPEHVVSVLQKDKVDSLIEKGEGPPEVILSLVDKKSVDEMAVDKILDEVFTDAEVMREIEKAPQGSTFLKKIRDRLKNKTIIYVGVGLMTLMALKEVVRGNLPGVPTSVVKVLD